jgi:large subunit ribosomal protein L10
MTSHDRKWKEAKKEEVVKLSKEYPFVAVATLEELPANILSVLRKKLKGEAEIIVAKTRVIQLAFKESGIDTSKIDDLVKENIAIIFSKKNPFELYSFIKKNKGDTTAKTGDIAIQDIIVQAGDTGLPPGPALSTLKAAGLKVAVQGPTISVTADKVVTKKGEEVTKEVADVLGKLNLKPMKVGMKLFGVLDKEDKEFYSAEALDVDEEELFNKFVLAYQQALNLSVNAEYYNDTSTEIILIKAEREAKAVQESTNSGEAKVAEEKAEEKEAKEDASSEEAEEVSEQAVSANKEEEEKKEAVEEAKKDEETAKEEKENEKVMEEEAKDLAEQKADDTAEKTNDTSQNEKNSEEEKKEEKK